MPARVGKKPHVNEKGTPSKQSLPVLLSTAGLCRTHTVHPAEGNGHGRPCWVCSSYSETTNAIPCSDTMLIKKMYFGSVAFTVRGE